MWNCQDRNCSLGVLHPRMCAVLATDDGYIVLADFMQHVRRLKHRNPSRDAFMEYSAAWSWKCSVLCKFAKLQSACLWFNNVQRIAVLSFLSQFIRCNSKHPFLVEVLELKRLLHTELRASLCRRDFAPRLPRASPTARVEAVPEEGSEASPAPEAEALRRRWARHCVQRSLT